MFWLGLFVGAFVGIFASAVSMASRKADDEMNEWMYERQLQVKDKEIQMLRQMVNELSKTGDRKD